MPFLFTEWRKQNLLFSSFAYRSIYVLIDDQNVLSGNVSNRQKYLIIQGDDVLFITDISMR